MEEDQDLGLVGRCSSTAPCCSWQGRQSKPTSVRTCLCRCALNNHYCFPEQVSRLHYIFTCLAEDTAGILINEEKGLLDFQGIYVAVSQTGMPFVLFFMVSIPGWLQIRCAGLSWWAAWKCHHCFPCKGKPPSNRLQLDPGSQNPKLKGSEQPRLVLHRLKGAEDTSTRFGPDLPS